MHHVCQLGKLKSTETTAGTWPRWPCTSGGPGVEQNHFFCLWSEIYDSTKVLLFLPAQKRSHGKWRKRQTLDYSSPTGLDWTGSVSARPGLHQANGKQKSPPEVLYVAFLFIYFLLWDSGCCVDLLKCCSAWWSGWSSVPLFIPLFPLNTHRSICWDLREQQHWQKKKKKVQGQQAQTVKQTYRLKLN